MKENTINMQEHWSVSTYIITAPIYQNMHNKNYSSNMEMKYLHHVSHTKDLFPCKKEHKSCLINIKTFHFTLLSHLYHSKWHLIKRNIQLQTPITTILCAFIKPTVIPSINFDLYLWGSVAVSLYQYTVIRAHYKTKSL